MRLKVIIHEYAHSLAHKHLKDNNKEYKEHRNQYETEAESIAYVVSKYLGLALLLIIQKKLLAIMTKCMKKI